MKNFKRLLLLLTIPLIFIACSPNPGTVNNDITETYNKNDSNTDNNSEKENTPIVDAESSEDIEEIQINLYIYSGTADKLFYIKNNVDSDNDTLVENTFNILKTTPHNSLIQNIPKTVSLNSYKIDGDTLTIDITSNFVKESNIGGGIEVNVLQCIVNTLGFATNTSKVIILLDGNPYSSGHILMNENEYFTVSTGGITEFNVQ